jgi:hypothetical protein
MMIIGAIGIHLTSTILKYRLLRESDLVDGAKGGYLGVAPSLPTSRSDTEILGLPADNPK